MQEVDGHPGPYLVLVDPDKGDEFLPAAEAMAALLGAATGSGSQAAIASGASPSTANQLTTGQLAFTGIAASSLVLLALALLGVGGLLVLWSRRRQRLSSLRTSTS